MMHNNTVKMKIEINNLGRVLHVQNVVIWVSRDEHLFALFYKIII